MAKKLRAARKRRTLRKATTSSKATISGPNLALLAMILVAVAMNLLGTVSYHSRYYKELLESIPTMLASPTTPWSRSSSRAGITTTIATELTRVSEDGKLQPAHLRPLHPRHLYIDGVDLRLFRPEDLFRPTPTQVAALTQAEAAVELFPPHVVAYAVSFIKCGGHTNGHAAGLVDASLVLRHSIHKISSRNPLSNSTYDYRFYAIVHESAAECFPIPMLRNLGFDDVIVVPQPVPKKDIRGKGLRDTIGGALCCGELELVKLHAYDKLPHEVVVHVDLDYAFSRPMDHLFDALLYAEDSPRGSAARSRLELERPTDLLPPVIGAFITRDWPQVAPRRFPPGFQAGFLVARRDPSIVPQVLNIVREGNYTLGNGFGTGWHKTGHGGYVGGPAMQGLLAYFYDYIRPGTAVELNACRHNHMGMNVRYDDDPFWNPRKTHKFLLHKCRNAIGPESNDDCEDCRLTPLDQIYSFHYTMCEKPWACTTREADKVWKGKVGNAWPLVDPDHCHGVLAFWHGLRADLEKQLYKLTGDETLKRGSSGPHRPEIFKGHCETDAKYVSMGGTEASRARIRELYETPGL